jgi:hypothetical protein
VTSASSSCAGVAVIAVSRPESRSFSHTSGFPNRVEMNTNFLLLAETLVRASNAEVVTCRGVPVMLVSMI